MFKVFCLLFLNFMHVGDLPIHVHILAPVPGAYRVQEGMAFLGTRVSLYVSAGIEPRSLEDQLVLLTINH